MSKIKPKNCELSPRERFVLNSIVENFVKKALPVGSKFIAQSHEIALSPATIRNVMMELERQGYIMQPHTSAGRMPTDKGYRFYVDSLMRMENLSGGEKDRIIENLKRVSRDIGYILEQASHTLAQISNLLGMVLAPRFYQGIFERMEFIPVAEKKVLVVISIRSGLVKTITMELQNDVAREALENTARIINERLHGLTLEEIKNTIDKRLKNIDYSAPKFIGLVVDSARFLFDFPSPADLHIGGASNIMSQPEFVQPEKLRNITDILDHREMMIHVLDQNDLEKEDGQDAEDARTEDDCEDRKIRIAIGEENREDLMQHCSLITATYHVGNISGTVGVIGPTRMQYSKIVSLVDYMAKALTDTLMPGNI